MLTDGCGFYDRTLRCGTCRIALVIRLKRILLGPYATPRGPERISRLGIPILRFLHASVLIRTMGRAGRPARDGARGAEAPQRKSPRSSSKDSLR